MSLFITVCVCDEQKTKENISAAYEQIRILFECGELLDYFHFRTGNIEYS
jgi:hypothetical protein